MWVFCCGMYRSGSTLQYQIAIDLVTRKGLGDGFGYVLLDDFKTMLAGDQNDETYKVIKSHAFIPEAESLFRAGKAKALFSYRDIRDVVVSYMTMQGVSFNKLLDEGFIYAVLKAYEDWTRVSVIHISRYEDLIADLPGEVARVADYLGINLKAEEAAEIAGEYSLERQKARMGQNRFAPSQEPIRDQKTNPKTLLKDNHIHSGAQGRWRTILAKREIALVEHIARDWMRERGYSFSQNRLMRYSSVFCFHVHRKTEALRRTCKSFLSWNKVPRGEN